MKKILALTFALMLILAACGSAENIETPPVAGTQAAAPTEPAGLVDGCFVEEKIEADGTKVTEYRQGGADGPLVRAVCEMTNGAYSETTFDAEGKISGCIAKETDGTVFEMYFYPSGNTSKDIIRYPDGSYQETRYLDDGSINEQTGEMFPGTVSYEKFISADGEVQEHTYGEGGEQAPETVYEEDGSQRTTTVLPDGTVIEAHISADLYIISQRVTAPDGVVSYKEFYKDGSVKIQIEETGKYKMEEHFDEEGYHTYYHQSGAVGDVEIITDETGKVVKVLVDGKEKSDIDTWVKDFNFRSW